VPDLHNIDNIFDPSGGLLSVRGGAGGLIGIQVFTNAESGNTYTATAGAKSALVFVTGSGGGGGGVDMAGASDDAAGGGGGAGQTIIEFFADVATIDGETITVPLGGAGGTAGGNGTVGSDTTLGAIITATGGGAGTGRTAIGISDGGSGGGISTDGDIQLAGGDGGHAIGFDNNNSQIAGGSGGASHWTGMVRGGSAFSGSTTSNTGDSAGTTQYGAGGGGAAVVNSTTAYNGGAGGQGLVVIYEYGIQSAGVPTERTTTSETLVLTDAFSVVRMNNASANTLNIPTNASVAFPIGTIIYVVQTGAGTTTIAGAGVTIRSRGSLLSINGQYGEIELKKIATDEWVVSGDRA
jgi:hypothetical protein